MKKLILTAFICVLSVLCYGDIQVNYPSNFDRLERKNTIGYTTKYGTGFPEYQPTTSPVSHYPGQRKSPQRPYSGGRIEDIADGIWIDVYPNWPGWVDDDYWSTLLKEHPELEPYAREWFESQGMHFPGDPYADPITDIPVIFTIVFLSIYLFYKKKTV